MWLKMIFFYLFFFNTSMLEAKKLKNIKNLKF